jgi:Xaa-Pro aminopeptidase
MKLLNEPRLKQFMSVAGLDCVVFASPTGTHYASGAHSWLDEQLREYMVAPAGGSQRVMHTFVVVPSEGPTALILNSGLIANAAASWISDVHAYGRRPLPVPTNDAAGTAKQGYERIANASAGAVDALVSVLTERGLSSSRVGVESEGMDAGLLVDLRGRLPSCELRDCTALTRLVRMVKTESELELMATAAEIAGRALENAVENLSSGATWATLSGHFRREIAKDGAEFDHFAWGADGVSLATVGPARMVAGTCACVDYGCTYAGYFSDSAVTVSLGEPPEAAITAYEGLERCIAAGLAQIRPGVTASAVQSAMQETLDADGVIADPPTGHGLGLAVRDLPILVADRGGKIRDDCVEVASDIPLEPNMVLNVEVSAFLPGLASVEIEKTVVVTPEGFTRLANQTHDEFIRN